MTHILTRNEYNPTSFKHFSSRAIDLSISLSMPTDKRIMPRLRPICFCKSSGISEEVLLRGALNSEFHFLPLAG